MRSFRDAKAMAKALRAELAARGTTVPHSAALEIVARQFGFDDWNVLAARIGAARPEPGPRTAVPVLRIFSVDKAREFYLDFLGFTVDWEHRFDPGSPVYLQVSRAGLTLHLSEHHGDGSPGAVVFVPVVGIEDLHRELSDKRYAYARPGIEDDPWHARSLTVTDPFGNTLRFSEPSTRAEPEAAVADEVVLPARIGRVWELITRAEHIRAWFAFDGAAVDLRPGGEIEHVWHEHGRYRGVIEEVVPGARLVYRYSSVPDARPEPGRQTTVVFTLEELSDGSTRVRVTEEGFDALEMGDADRRAHADGARQGWQGGLDGLARLAAPAASAGEGPA
ncbi:glyoxalase superfamily protein [Nocardiopsis mangrovi]|uniref:Bleomycin resistance protein n=1 Tax=Nocardiopsis mangrovi TaxID=1179818 RepID=A0ABV9E0Z1_9ACTN